MKANGSSDLHPSLLFLMSPLEQTDIDSNSASFYLFKMCVSSGLPWDSNSHIYQCKSSVSATVLSVMMQLSGIILRVTFKNLAQKLTKNTKPQGKQFPRTD